MFKEPEKVIGNIERMTEFLKQKAGSPREVLSLVRTREQKAFYRDESGTYWRMYDFIGAPVCLERLGSAEELYQCAVAFGRFVRDLADFPAETLYEIIPDFHNTPKKYDKFLRHAGSTPWAKI